LQVRVSEGSAAECAAHEILVSAFCRGVAPIVRGVRPIVPVLTGNGAQCGAPNNTQHKATVVCMKQ
jgi:hypothetical protein